MSLEASVLILLKQESETSDHVLSSSGLVSPRAVVALGRREISFMPSMASRRDLPTMSTTWILHRLCSLDLSSLDLSMTKRSIILPAA